MNTSQRALIIGDIHGCWDELRDLLDAAALTSEDRIISVGDMVDRGPASEQVWRFFAEHSQTDAIVGNHEQKCLRWHRGELRPALSQRITRRQHGEAAWAEACAWFATLPRSLDVANVRVVHGFWQPGRSLEEQHPTVLTGTMSGAKRVAKLPRSWYELYDGDRPLVVGHAIYHDDGSPLIWRDRVYGVDTGCVHGMTLTGILVPEMRIVSVPSRGDHWRALRDDHADLRFAGMTPDRLEWDAARSVADALRIQGHDAAAEKAAEIDRMLADAAREEARLLAAVEAAHAAALAALPAGWTDLAPSEQGRLYARAIGATPLKSLLHRRRQTGAVDLRGSWKRPAAFLRFAATITE